MVGWAFAVLAVVGFIAGGYCAPRSQRAAMLGWWTAGLFASGLAFLAGLVGLVLVLVIR